MLCVCVCLSCVLILIFRRALLSTPTRVNTPADQMTDNDFQIDTLYSSSWEKSMSPDCFFPKTIISHPKATICLSLFIYLLLSQFLSLYPSSHIHSALNTTEIGSIHAAFHRGFTVNRYREISLWDDQVPPPVCCVPLLRFVWLKRDVFSPFIDSM